MALRLKPYRKGSLMEDAMLDKPNPYRLRHDSGFAIHLVRSHFKQLAIGACDPALSTFAAVGSRGLRKRYSRSSSPCPVKFNGGWNTRFDNNGSRKAAASSSRCTPTAPRPSATTTIAGRSGASSIRPLASAVCPRCSSQRRAASARRTTSTVASRPSRLALTGSTSSAEANNHVLRQKDQPSDRDDWEERQWWGFPKTRIPGVARQVLHRTISEMEGLFGQGKEFFQSKKQRKHKR